MKSALDAAREALANSELPDELEQAIDDLRTRYFQARTNEIVKYPIRWALYHTWRDFCGDGDRDEW